MSTTQRDIMAGIINAAMEEWDDAKPGTFAFHMAGHVADRLSAAGFGPVQEAKCEAWEAGKNAVWTFMSNQDPRRERPTNPYRTEASS